MALRVFHYLCISLPSCRERLKQPLRIGPSIRIHAAVQVLEDKRFSVLVSCLCLQTVIRKPTPCDSFLMQKNCFYGEGCARKLLAVSPVCTTSTRGQTLHSRTFRIHIPVPGKRATHIPRHISLGFSLIKWYACMNDAELT